MQVRYWGTRGSIATLGEHTQQYGGHTPCVTIANGDCLIILDAGSGIHRLTQEKFYRHFKEVHILLSHLHMDHIQGLGFFDMFFDPELGVHLWGPPSAKSSLQSRLSRYLSPPLFPFTINEFQGKLEIHEIHQEQFNIGPFKVRTQYVCHPGPTLGFRVETDGKVCAYLPDHEPALGSVDFPNSPEWTSGYSVAKEADLLIHDAQYTEDEYKTRVGWGHSTYKQALDFARLSRVQRLDLFHHDPNHTDEDLNALLSALATEPGDPRIGLAAEGAVIDL